MTDIQQIIPLFILIPLLGVFLLALLARKNNIYADVIFFVITVILLLICGYLFSFKGKNLLTVYCLNAGQLPEAISLVIDGLAVFFLGGIYLVSFCIMIYSFRFMDNFREKWKFYALFLLLLTGVNGVILSGDLFTLYLFLEVASLAAYALVYFSLKGKALGFGFKYMIRGIMASAIIFLGLAVCYCFTSTLALADIANQIFIREHIAADPSMSFVVLFIQSLLFLGFLIKSGIFPFDSWVAYTQESVLAPVAAILAAVVIPGIGLYPFMRMYFNVIGPTAGSLEIIRIFAGLSILGALFSRFKIKSSRQVIAYQTISEFGFVILALGVYTPLSIFGGMLQMLNAQICAALANCNTGLIDYISAQNKSARQSGFSFKQMPGTFLSTIFGGLAFSNIPPFFGFWTKVIIIFAAWKAGYKQYAFVAVLAMLWGAGLFINDQRQLFLKANNPGNTAKLKKLRPSMAVSLLLLIGLCLGLNILLLPEAKNSFVKPTVQTIIAGTKYSKAVFKAGNEK